MDRLFGRIRRIAPVLIGFPMVWVLMMHLYVGMGWVGPRALPLGDMDAFYMYLFHVCGDDDNRLFDSFCAGFVFHVSFYACDTPYHLGSNRRCWAVYGIRVRYHCLVSNWRPDSSCRPVGDDAEFSKYATILCKDMGSEISIWNRHDAWICGFFWVL